MSDLFISYARADAQLVRAIIARLEHKGLSVWYDAAELKAGENWDVAIREALSRARAVVTFISESSAHSRWVLGELRYALENRIKAIPVLLPGASLRALPPDIQLYQFVDLSAHPAKGVDKAAAQAVAEAFARLERDSDRRPLRADEIPGFARAAEIQAKNAASDDQPSNSIFIVHGHDEEMLSGVTEFLREKAIDPIVLRDIDARETSLLDRFFEVGGKARDAIALLSADDYGASVKQYDHPGVSERALQFRARQNVILELGYFYGLLGWDRVYVLERAPSQPFPNFERPSDLHGKVFNSFDPAGAWGNKLIRHLRQNGYNV